MFRSFAVAGLLAWSAFGQTVDLKTLPRRFAADEWQIWTSPFRPGNRSARTMTYALPFAAVTGALIATDRKTNDLLPNSRDQVVWSGRVSQFGASYSLVGVVGATYLVGKLTHSLRAQETGLLALEALGHTQIATLAFKKATSRERPLDHDRRGEFWEGGTSFPSGHAASAFAVATVFAHEYRDHVAVPIVAYSLAGAISASRVGAQRHWVADVVAGGSLGFLIGRFTYRRNHDGSLPGGRATRTQRLIPQVGISGTTVTLSWKL